jgi:multicomponent Na+:H+ antiporter subunit D
MNYLLAVLIAPLSVLLFLPLKARFRNLFYLIALLVSLGSVYSSAKLQVGIGFSIPSLFLEVVVDKYARIFLQLISACWLISIIYSFEFTKYHFQERKTRFFILLNTLLTAVMLNACAGNLQTLFLFYSVGIPITYPLITLRGNPEALRSGKKFLLQTTLPSLFLFLPAIFIVWQLTGSTSFAGDQTLANHNVSHLIGGGLLAMFVIGISKNSVFPFHGWLPSTYSAPAPVSGLIHSVAAVKSGSIALIKIAIHIFGLEYIHQLTSEFLTGGWLTYLCGLTAVYTAYRALLTDNFKQRLGYSTVGQLSYIILAILIGTNTGIIAAMLHIVTHAIAKACLFYVAGFYNSIYRTVSVAAIAKIMPQTRLIALVIAICGLSITGFPFLAGYYSKDLMLVEEWQSHYYASAIFLVIGSIVNIAYIIGPVQNAFHRKDPTVVRQPVPISMVVTFIISIALILASNFFVGYFTLQLN